MDPTGNTRQSWQVRLPLARAVAVLACAVALLAPGEEADAQGAAPSFVVIQTDDQTIDSLYARFRSAGGGEIRSMPATLDLIAKRGITFNRYYVPYPLCCPSRVSLLTGRYSHNNNVRGNNPPNGGYTGFAARAASRHNVATWLQRAGYRTIHVGKVMNGYGQAPYSDGTEVPPGWSSWYGIVNVDQLHLTYGYTLNVNGELQGPFGEEGDWPTREWGKRDDPGCPFAPLDGQPCFHVTDKLTQIAADEMAATPPEQPFYVQLDYTAPHGDFRRPAGPEPAPRHNHRFRGARHPHNRAQGFDEGNVSDKPRFIRDADHLTPQEKRTYRVYYQKQLESLRTVDDGVRQVIGRLSSLGRLQNTYVIFTSDNGFFFGEHRLLGGKFLAYEPATKMPFLIRGPGIKPGSSTGELAANIDVAPTLLELAGAKADKSLDGRSLVPYFRDPDLRTRRPILFESFVATNDVEPNTTLGARVSRRAGASSVRGGGEARASLLAPPKDYAGIRLGPYKYIAWPSGEKELYNITRDPYELNSLHRIPNFFPIRNFLHRQMHRLIACVARECSEVAPKMPLTRKEFQRFQAQKRKEIREKERKREQARRERERGRRGR